MQVTAKLKYLRVTARKTREVIDLIRDKTATEAKVLLSFALRKSAIPVLKLLNSAITSAKNDLSIDEENLYISKITVDEGPTLKRWHAMSRGRAYPIMKRSVHITIILSEINPKKEAKIGTKEIKKEKKVKKQKKQIKNKINKKITIKKKK